MTPTVTLLVPGSLDTHTGGYAYDREIVRGLRTRGWKVVVQELDPSFPQPTDQALDHARRVLSEVETGGLVVIDGLALGAMPDLAELERQRLVLVALVHHPLARETGLAPDIAARLALRERRALACVRRVIVTSRATADEIERYGVARARVAVVQPGTVPAPVARGSQRSGVHLLSVGTLMPRKGHSTLLQALALVVSSNWRLTCVGSLVRDSRTADAVRAEIDALGLSDRVTLTGELEPAALERVYDAADVFVLPTMYEGYGMAIAEAIARGLPVLSTPTGAIPEIVGRGGILVEPGDVPGLAGALDAVISGPSLRRQLAGEAVRMRAELPTWEASCDLFAEALREAIGHEGGSFDASWLAVREPCDANARSLTLARLVARLAGKASPVRALDLATGTGANVRYLAPLCGENQDWVLTDKDASLLARLPERMSLWAAEQDAAVQVAADSLTIHGDSFSATLTSCPVDLSFAADERLFAGRTLVTASALLDLVSESWLSAVVRHCRLSGAVVLFALSYNGEWRCSPDDPDDEMVRSIVNRDQRRDKGFGAALGPLAGHRAAGLLAEQGYHVQRERSDWVISSEATTLQRQLLAGWADAARSLVPRDAAAIDGWLRRRRSQVDDRALSIHVGHDDVGAWLR